MHTTKRGEPLPINQALNRPRAKLGLDFNLDGDLVCGGNGFPRRISNSYVAFSDARRRRVAHCPQTPKDVPTLGPKPQPKELL